MPEVTRMTIIPNFVIKKRIFFIFDTILNEKTGVLLKDA